MSEMEEVAKWMISHSYATGHGDTIADMLIELEGHVRCLAFERAAEIGMEEMRRREKDGYLSPWLISADWLRAAILAEIDQPKQSGLKLAGDATREELDRASRSRKGK
jgi:hypothetical protein